MPRRPTSLPISGRLFDRAVAAALLAVVAPRALALPTPSLSLEVGQQTAVSTEDGNLSKLLFYAQPSLRWSFTGPGKVGEIDVDGSIRAFADTEEPVQSFDRQNKIEINASLTRERWKVVIGLQEIAWGETFGIPVVDLVNPRDYTDPIIQEPSWERLPVAALSGQAFLGKLTLQAVLTPIARDNRYPSAPSPAIPLRTQPTREASGTPEFGGRASYLFENGLDLALIYYRHWNRNPVYELTPSITLVPVQEPVHSLGTTFSFAAGSFVFRGDALLSLDAPVAGSALGQVVRGRTRWLGTLGSDLTTEDGWTVGFQYQAQAEMLTASTRDFHWVSAKVSRSFLDGKLVPEIFFFVGLNNPDRWLQPRLTWNIGNHLSVQVRADLIRAGTSPADGILWLVKGESRVMSWVVLKF